MKINVLPDEAGIDRAILAFFLQRDVPGLLVVVDDVENIHGGSVREGLCACQIPYVFFHDLRQFVCDGVVDVNSGFKNDIQVYFLSVACGRRRSAAIGTSDAIGCPEKICQLLGSELLIAEFTAGFSFFQSFRQGHAGCFVRFGERNILCRCERKAGKKAERQNVRGRECFHY